MPGSSTMKRVLRLTSLTLVCLWLSIFPGHPSSGEETEEAEKKVLYATPKVPVDRDPFVFLAESFDDPIKFKNQWIKSKAMKEGMEEALAQYKGEWGLEALLKDALVGDKGMVLKTKVAHSAISTMLKKPFVFKREAGKKDLPLVVQYEVGYQDGIECGGAYIKLLSDELGKVNLSDLTNKTPYTIMFGPDKCGNDYKLHFIIRYRNPKTGDFEEKHANKPAAKLEAYFNDKQPHLYTLVLRPDGKFTVSVDGEVVSSGNLLEDFTPPFNPPKEIDDPNDSKPEDWDERETIPDPEAKKPDDWDEDAPRFIKDENAVMPDGWMEDEEEMIPDPEATKPDDWDEELDGDWEPPLVNNPKCDTAPGCGKWDPPTMDNPDYKGKWYPPQIKNPAYKGVWAPRKIPNPDSYEDLKPFENLAPIVAAGFEIWSMNDNIYFDNLVVTQLESVAQDWARDSFHLRKSVRAEVNGEDGVVGRFMAYSQKNPWIWAVVVLVVGVPVVVLFTWLCSGSSEKKEVGEAKKTDQVTPDDEVTEEGSTVATQQSDLEVEEEEEEEEKEDDAASKEEGDQEEEEEEEGGKEGSAGGDVPAARKRRARKE
ncbi:unnamed protein product [Cyprideis torosa]|uniref:Uncharacterized protein n=1 Tax=Cyprideis torosa TaxID=163714 RepID=A0A7R8ZPI8_9CRUS|nr:unnamed protein product [Cyprideis torosa]CAG0894049.1 unnamed protein product [Cyprideis torosa]